MIKSEALSNIDPVMAGLFEFKLSKGDLKRSEVIIATIDCLAEEGLEKTSFEAIAQRMGTQKSHVNYYFKNKNDIFYEVFRYIASTYQSYSIRELAKAKNSKDQLNKFVDAYFLWAEENQQQLSAMFLLYYFCFHKPRFKEINQKIRQGGVQRIAHLVKLSSTKDISETRAQTIAKGIQAILANTAVDIYTFKEEDSHKESREKEARKLIRMLLKQN